MAHGRAGLVDGAGGEPRRRLGGYVRLNRAGREAAGILSPSAADEVADRIAEGLASFVDADTGEPVVRETVRIERLLPDGPARDLLPDLIVDWAGTPAARHRQIVSPRHGDDRLADAGAASVGSQRQSSRRRVLFGARAGLAPGAGPAGDILDLAPTVLARLGAEVPATMRGHPLLGPGGQ